MSRGTGVPDSTIQAFRQVSALLERAQADGTLLRMREDRIGLEGERRLRFQLAAGEASLRLLERVQAIVRRTELLRLVEEPYDPS